jgi:hypothetical protein
MVGLTRETEHDEDGGDHDATPLSVMMLRDLRRRLSSFMTALSPMASLSQRPAPPFCGGAAASDEAGSSREETAGSSEIGILDLVT